MPVPGWHICGSSKSPPAHPLHDQAWDCYSETLEGKNLKFHLADYYKILLQLSTPILWPPHVKSWLIGKNPDAGRDWGQEEKGTTEDGWLHGITDSMDGSLSEFWEMVMDREAWHAANHGITKSRTWLSDWTELNREPQRDATGLEFKLQSISDNGPPRNCTLDYPYLWQNCPWVNKAEKSGRFVLSSTLPFLQQIHTKHMWDAKQCLGVATLQTTKQSSCSHGSWLIRQTQQINE